MLSLVHVSHAEGHVARSLLATSRAVHVQLYIVFDYRVGSSKQPHPRFCARIHILLIWLILLIYLVLWIDPSAPKAKKCVHCFFEVPLEIHAAARKTKEKKKVADNTIAIVFFGAPM